MMKKTIKHSIINMTGFSLSLSLFVFFNKFLFKDDSLVLSAKIWYLTFVISMGFILKGIAQYGDNSFQRIESKRLIVGLKQKTIASLPILLSLSLLTQLYRANDDQLATLGYTKLNFLTYMYDFETAVLFAVILTCVLIIESIYKGEPQLTLFTELMELITNKNL